MSTDLGQFRVTAEAAAVAAFRKATGLDDGDATLPLTYPICWLVTPAVRAATVAMVPEPNLVLVHEAQTFEYERPLRAGDAYVLSLQARRENAPDRLLVDGTLADASGQVCAKVDAILRLFSTEAAAA